MSTGYGNVWGGVVGAIVGTYFGNPQLGWMVGSAIGGYIDPQRIEGPRLRDSMRQTSQQGVPIPFGYGTFPTAGNVIWRDPELREHADDGKGGPVVSEYTYTRSYAIGICEGPITGLMIVRRNGLIVYDQRPDSVLAALGYDTNQIAETRAAQAKFLDKATIYLGDETQTPDSTIEAIEGAGNVPAYRGLAYLVMTDEDLTQEQGAIPQWEFVVSACGEEIDPVPAALELLDTVPIPATCLEFDPTGNYLAVGGYFDEPTDSWFKMYHIEDGILVEQVVNYTFTQRTQGMGWAATGGRLVVAFEHGAIVLASAGGSWEVAGTILDPGHLAFPHIRGAAFSPSESHIAIAYEFGPSGGGGVVCLFDGDGYDYIVDADTNLSSPPQAFQAIGFFPPEPLPLNNIAAVALDSAPGLDVFSVFGNDWGERMPGWPETTSGAAYHPRFNRHGTLAFITPDSSSGWVIYDDGTVLSSELPAVDNPGTDTRHLSWSPEGLHIAVGDRIMRNSAGAYSLFQHLDLATTGASSFSGNGEFFAIGHSGGVNLYTGFGLSASGQEIPDSPGYYVDNGTIIGPAGVTIDRCRPTLGEIVADLCERVGVTDYDVSELIDQVDGFKVATETGADAAIASLMPAFFFDATEYDGKIWFPKRGGDVSFALTMDDLADRDGDAIEFERVQEAELLRKVTVGYIDPAATYTVNTQTWERRTSTVLARGESAREIPVTIDQATAAQAAEKSGKVAWAELDKLKLCLPYRWAKITPADVGTITDRAGTVHRIRPMKIDDDSGVRYLEAAKERLNTYESSATGVSGTNPAFPGSGVLGPTVSAVLNLPAYAVAHDAPGLYVAAYGPLSGWQGYRLQMDRGFGWETVGNAITASSIIGSLVESLPVADPAFTDTTNTLTVTVNGDLSSATTEEVLNGANAAAILYTDGTAEIIQWEDATEIAIDTFELTTLQRGRLDTTVAEHSAGAVFVVLDASVQFVTLAAADLGKTITFRMVTLGTDPEANDSQSITIAEFESQREWSPTNVEATRDGSDNVTVTWDGRPALGTNVQPQHHAAFVGYQVAYSDGVTTVNKMVARTPLVIVGGVVQADETTTHTYTAAEQTTDFGSVPVSLDIEVSAVNSITGAGPATGTTV